MTTYAPTDCDNPSEQVKKPDNTLVIGSCILCWGAIGFAIITGLMGKLLGLF
jgi:hypothetical protein